MFVFEIRVRIVKTLLIAGFLLSTVNAMAEAVPVELLRTEDGWQLLRDGKPYLIKGAGGEYSLPKLAAAGANSVRTWDAEGIDELLDEAHSLGLTVTVGIWLGHERHGFDYNDKNQVAEQMERARRLVTRYKDHPAVLLWGIGNEMEGFDSGDNPAVWKAVNDIAAMVKQLDPNHPTMSVTSEIGGGRIDSLHKQSPAIDIHGINSYGGALSLADRLRAGGGSKPFVLTEFCTPGPWEAQETEWGAPFEPTSTDKADFYAKAYKNAVTDAPGLSLGSYAFVWGFKMESTATWFGMFLSDGSSLGAVDVMSEFWTGSPPENFAPVVTPLTMDQPTMLEPGDTVFVKASISDPEGGDIRTRWLLRPESTEYSTGGDFRPDLPEVEGAVIEASAEGATVRLPTDPGPYRLFLYAYDDSGRAATANIPLLVKGEVGTRFPVTVYEDGLDHMPWAPTGWMGVSRSLTMDGNHRDNPQSGVASIKLRYGQRSGWVGVAWQNPPGNWGDQDGGYDLTGATALELWARGEKGGERIGFGVGLIGGNKPYPDSAIEKVDGVVLTREWQRYIVPLENADLSKVSTGFVVTLTGRKKPITVYLDSIRFIR